MVDYLLPEHVELPHVLDLRGGHYETFSLLELFPRSTPSWLKVMGGGVGWWWPMGFYCQPKSQLDLDFNF